MMRVAGIRLVKGKYRWILDSGASSHYTSNLQILCNTQNIKPTPMKTANKIIYATAKGNLVLQLSCGTIYTADVMYAPGILPSTHLISIGQLEAKGPDSP